VRPLLAVDDSANGKFTSYIADTIAGSRGIPITILQLLHGNEMPRKKKAAPEGVIEETVKGAAENTNRSESREDEPASVDVTVREISETPNEDAVMSEAKKGYGLLFVGIDDIRVKDGTFTRFV
jgi:hypothetical protein